MKKHKKHRKYGKEIYMYGCRASEQKTHFFLIQNTKKSMYKCLNVCTKNNEK